MTSTARLLLIDDDSRLHELLRGYLVQHGFTVDGALDGEHGLAALAARGYDAVLLDVMMPGIDGLEVCRRIRRTSRVPVVMLTARGDETDRIVGLELGADDYLPKPFNPRELLARLRAVLRRAQPEAVGERVTAGPLVVDLAAREARLAGSALSLTAIELDILAVLVRRAGRVVPRDAILEEAGRGGVVVGERTIDVHISHLRQKLADAGASSQLIRTVRGVGYQLAKDGA